MRLAKNPSLKGIDLISPLGVNVEVKFDRRMESTGNIFIEFECSGKPSGLFNYDSNINLFAYGNNTEFYLFNNNKLKKLIQQFIRDNTYRVVKAGDGYRVKGMIIPIVDLLPKLIAVRKFIL